ncbi:hypothetical protein RHGRI_020813 [Rhododendron griersonianum]|uniref:Uncharacterized protein n=1 Tax=Rhododendron griersonianum TaxID=479676 RepID=A0AAV6JL46_9ERIC|nr:hypothetical protein RHGRI_020813 [Rhododendron griersonianum]
MRHKCLPRPELGRTLMLSLITNKFVTNVIPIPVAVMCHTTTLLSHLHLVARRLGCKLFALLVLFDLQCYMSSRSHPLYIGQKELSFQPFVHRVQLGKEVLKDFNIKEVAKGVGIETDFPLSIDFEVSTGLSARAIVGIVAASFVLLVLILVVLWMKGCLGGKDLENKGHTFGQLKDMRFHFASALKDDRTLEPIEFCIGSSQPSIVTLLEIALSLREHLDTPNGMHLGCHEPSKTIGLLAEELPGRHVWYIDDEATLLSPCLMPLVWVVLSLKLSTWDAPRAIKKLPALVECLRMTKEHGLQDILGCSQDLDKERLK